MPLPRLSLAIVGADYPNKRGPGRRFELAMCKPGEPIELRPEPTNPADPHAVAVYSARGIQIGYVTAERAPLVGRHLRDGEVCAVYQGPATFGAWVRVSFDGAAPDLPDVARNRDNEFWPDPTYDD